MADEAVRASQVRVARPGVFLGVAVAPVIWTAGIGDGRVTGLPAIFHLADETLGTGRGVLLSTTDETRHPDFARVVEGSPDITLLRSRAGRPLAVLAMHLRANGHTLVEPDAFLAHGT
jgi:hypothetical protein